MTEQSGRLKIIRMAQTTTPMMKASHIPSIPISIPSLRRPAPIRRATWEVVP